MPTKTSVPVNFSDMSNTNITKIRSGAKWKGFGMTTSYDCQVQNGFFGKAGGGQWNCVSGATGGNKTKIFPKKYNVVGMYKPFVNYQSGKGSNNGSIGFKDNRKDCLTSIKEINDGENLAYPGTGEPYGGNSSSGNDTRKDPHAFKARPMKHYRLQYGNDNNKQTYNNRYLLNTINKPGGIIMKSHSGMIAKTVKLGDGTKVVLDKEWVENQAGFNVIKYGKDRGLYSASQDKNDCGDKSDWVKLLEAGVSKDDIIKYGLYNSSLFNGQDSGGGADKMLMKGLGSAITAYPNYTLGKFNKVGKYNPIYFSTSEANERDGNPSLITENYTPNADWACKNCPNYQCKDTVNEDGKPGKPLCAQGNVTCVNICDPPTKAKKRVRTSSRINNPALCQRSYYTDNSAYLRSRCKSFSQNEYHYDIQLDNKSGQPDPNAPCGKGWRLEDGKLVPSTEKSGCCGRSAACSKAYRSNCPTKKLRKDCNGNILDCQNKLYYKPNNCQFAQQGGVSSSSRLLRLKLNTINSNATSIGKSYGKSAGSALAYSGRPEAPFINKEKMNAGGYLKNRDWAWVLPIIDATTGTIISYDYYPMYNKDWSLNPKPEPRDGYKPRKVLNKMPCDNNLYFLYRPGGGNHVTSVMNNENNNKIIGKFNPTSEYPNFNNDPGSDNKKFWFIERQNKTINKNYTKNNKVGF